MQLPYCQKHTVFPQKNITSSSIIIHYNIYLNHMDVQISNYMYLGNFAMIWRINENLALICIAQLVNKNILV